jgi:DNA-binding NtrC family response regulator
VKVLRQLHRINPAMFVLIISAYATVENAVEAFTAGAFDYLVKPVRFEELVKRLQRLFKFQDLVSRKSATPKRPGSQRGL